jgi:N6-adenosine-specific RNA methylase IME4/ParB-like chromosome segregation protein Spo0J
VTAAPTPQPILALPIADIRVGARHRKYLGDLKPLAASIAENGLLHPIPVKPDGTLIAGERRLRAVQELGWATVPVTVLEPTDLLKAEADENTLRLDFAPSEAVAIADALRPVVEAQAKERQRAGGGTRGRGKLPHPEPRTRDRLAAAVGLSGRTLDKAAAVVAAAHADPEMGDLVSEMDATGKVDAAFRELQRRKNRQLVAATPTVATHVNGQRYRTIVLDPPWDFDDEGDGDPLGCSRPTYATMPIADIASQPIADLADPAGCHLYLWITNRSLPKGFELLNGWGFRYVTALTWCKPSPGVGTYYRGSTEHVLFGVRGSLPLLYQDTGTWFAADRGGRHSAKPEEFFHMVRRLSPGPRIEMFARGEREGFVTWGAEA